VTHAQLLKRGRELLASLSLGEDLDLISEFRNMQILGAKLADLPYSPAIRRLCRWWTNRTGREWTEGEMYYVLVAASAQGN
jgi:hypothetical protein